MGDPGSLTCAIRTSYISYETQTSYISNQPEIDSVESEFTFVRSASVGVGGSVPSVP